MGRFLRIALGSASEVQYLPLLARDLGLLNEPTFRDLDLCIIEVRRMLSALMQRVTSAFDSTNARRRQ
jgi:four helix bundle protein